MSALQASGHEDDFSRRHLPPIAQWPELLAPPRGLSYPARLNAAEALVDAQVSAGHGQRVALRGAGLVWTYAQLQAQVDRIVQVIRQDWRLPTGARILLRGANHPMLAACWLAVVKAGCVAVTTMPLLRARELAVIARKAEVGGAFCQADLLAEWQGAVASLERPWVPHAAKGQSPRNAEKAGQLKAAEAQSFLTHAGLPEARWGRR